ncbi:hypothetical protein TL16_g03946 [Triparma laevis f. inornata]|uniref:Uncharacterized protein n=2 Tax=Triparma laevis TaxID=1534972 RepID=A0A9W6ZMI7_9STRA|nr:hypothetical protein TrLO_g4487 [Triparma laevis f. longispina]GMH64368.1 hypothetical protein TL16_g03946 [Triparma laevis f. inornata]
MQHNNKRNKENAEKAPMKRLKTEQTAVISSDTTLFEIGQKVQVKWPDGKECDGVIEKQKNKNRYEVGFDDKSIATVDIK